MNNIYLALVHYPVYNKFQEVVTTSITNLDIHDISRSCITFNVKNYFIVNRLQSQKDLFDRITGFWKTEVAKHYNQDRVDALQLIKYASDIDITVREIEKQEGTKPIVITTTAATRNDQLKFDEFELIRTKNKPILLVFGTGNGLVEEIHKNADYVLEPIKGGGIYNHLSVRSAVAIVLDRLTSEK